MIVDCVSDLHGNFPAMPGGDLLIIAGDLTARDAEYEYTDKFLPWLINQSFTNYKKIVWIGGNHDNWVQKNISIQQQFSGGEYLCDSGTEFEGLKIWGSPWTKTFPGMNPHCKAFTCDTEEELAKKWALIPEDTDILVTHGPPHGILDKTLRGEHVGSKSLKIAIDIVKPKAIFYGHIHEFGLKFTTENDMLFVNASYVDELYRPRKGYIRCQIQNTLFMASVIHEQKK